MKWYQRLKQEHWFNMACALCIAIVFYFIVKNLGKLGAVFSAVFTVISPLIVGLIFAYVINPIAKTFEKLYAKKIKRDGLAWKLAVFTAIVVVVAVIIALLALLIPSIISSVSGFIANIEKNMDHLVALSDNIGLDKASEYLDKVDATAIISAATEYINGEAILKTSASVGTVTGNILIGFVLAIYYLLDKARLKKSAEKLFRFIIPKDSFEPVARFWSNCNDILINYISYSLLEAGIVGVANAVFMLITGMPYVVVVSVIVGVTNLAPTFGPLIGAAIGALILLLSNPVDVIYFLIFTAILQTIDGYVIKPKLFSGTLGVSSLLILVSIIVLGKIFGVVGILLAIPIAAILQYLVREFLNARKDTEQTE